jgi:hypothetical protein
MMAINSKYIRHHYMVSSVAPTSQSQIMKAIFVEVKPMPTTIGNTEKPTISEVKK